MSFLRRVFQGNRGDIWSSLAGSNSMTRTPLDTSLFLKGQDFPTTAPSVGALQQSALPNGIRVASVQTATPVANVGVVVRAGVRDETPELRGVTQFLEWMAFKSTMIRDEFDVVRSLGARAANITSSSSRETQILSAEVMPDFADFSMDVIGDIIKSHKYVSLEVDQVRAALKMNLEYPIVDAPTEIYNAVHVAAYHQNTLGNRTTATAESLARITPQVLFDWNRKYYVPQNLAVVGVGVSHEELVAMAQRNFGDMKAPSEVPERTAARYTGGSEHWYEDSSHGDPFTHVALAFELTGWDGGDQENVASAVLQSLMGGGGSFSAGGPGKGMYSRIYGNVLNRHHWVNSMQAFSFQHSDSGVFGIYGSAMPDAGAVLTDTIVQQLLSMTGPIDAEELQRAKNLLRSGLFMQSESRGVLLEDAGLQLLMRGEVKSTSVVADMIEAATATDVQNAAKKMLASKVTMSVIGNGTNVPHLDQVKAHFQ